MAFVHSQTVARDLDLLFVLLPDLGRWFQSLYPITHKYVKGICTIVDIYFDFHEPADCSMDGRI